MGDTLVVGLGSTFRGDDAAGLAVVDRLRKSEGRGLRVLAETRGWAGVLDHWTGQDDAIVVDSAQSGCSPGRVWRFDGLTESIPERLFRTSTHAVGFGEAVGLAGSLGRLPRKLVVFGIEGEAFEPGSGLSPRVEASVEKVVDLILRECRAHNAG